jgi:hypothetical protein
MAGLVDIAPATETVTIRGTAIEVYGVSAAGVAHLLARFPALRQLMSGVEASADDLMALAGEAVAPVIAAGTGAPGDADAEAAAGRLSIDEQADLLSAIFRLTFPQGVGPFVEKLGALAGSAASPAVPASKSRKQ